MNDFEVYRPDDYDEEPIPEETICCCVCAMRMTPGDDLVLIDTTKVKLTPACNGAFCGQCAELIHLAYLESCREAGICEHGNDDGDWCEECNREYKEAAKRYEEENQC